MAVFSANEIRTFSLKNQLSDISNTPMINLLHLFACITRYYFIFIPRKLQDFFVNKETYCSDTDTILGKQTFMYYYAFWKKGPKISLKQVFEH